MGSSSRPKTRSYVVSKLSNFVGKGKEFEPSEVPTLRAVIQRGILIKQEMMIEEDTAKQKIERGEIVRALAPLVLAQWYKANAKFRPPVTVKEKSLAARIERLWARVDNVAWGRANKKEKEEVEKLLDRLLDITICRHPITLCQDPESCCTDQEKCKIKAHIKCCCPLPNKIPKMELRWPYSQRQKRGEKSDMTMGGDDKEESRRQRAAAKRKAHETEAQEKRRKKQQEEEGGLFELQEQSKVVEERGEEGEGTDEEFSPPVQEKKRDQEAQKLVDRMLKDRLGDLAHLVVRYLDRPRLRNNTMSVIHTARGSLRCGISAAAAATVASEFLKDLIAAGHLAPEMAYLACDPSKMKRARKVAIAEATKLDKEKQADGNRIIGMGYDGRKDSHTRAMMADSSGKMRMRIVKEEHVTISEEPSGKYLHHFVPEEAVPPEKPAQKIAEALRDLLEEHDSLDSLMILKGDSTTLNTGWRRGVHAQLEKLLGRKLYWGYATSTQTNCLSVT